MTTSKLRYGCSQHCEHGACHQQSGEREPPILQENCFSISFYVLRWANNFHEQERTFDNVLGFTFDHLSNRILRPNRENAVSVDIRALEETIHNGVEFFEILRCKGHRRKEKIYDRRMLQVLL